ncbi:hypothetical protein ACIBCD_31655 [Nocardia brasiliensis]
MKLHRSPFWRAVDLVVAVFVFLWVFFAELGAAFVLSLLGAPG